MTIDVMRKFGVEVHNNNYHTLKSGRRNTKHQYTVEGLFPGRVFCGGRLLGYAGSIGSLQGDREIINILKRRRGGGIGKRRMAAIPSKLHGWK